MGTPYKSMNRRKERTEVVAAYIKGGAIPDAEYIAAMLGVSKSTAQRTIVLALDYLANGGNHETPFDSSKKMIPRCRILCNGISLGEDSQPSLSATALCGAQPSAMWN